jgi:SpoVK/Ycf46/Vps4 family AAA+-type ATPase|tara:strand:+ start:13889 stop:15370 length:1482 start_codon:yes stop_codon:yes gene_type:complete
MNFLNEFVLLLKARYPIIYISTNEEERIEYLIKYCAKKYVARTYYSWDFVDGYQGNPNDKGFAARNPLEALDLIDKLTPETASLFVLKDYDNFLKDFSVVRKLKNLSRSLKTQPKNIIIVSSEINIPDSLKEFVTLLEFPLPSYSEILEELNRLLSSLQQEIDPTTLNNIATACQGLSLERIRRVLSKVIAKNGEIDDSSPPLILQEKKQIIQQTQLLEFCLNDKNLDDLGGLDVFKQWLQVRDQAFSQEAIKYGLPYPKGLLLVGVQGTGKSVAAKIIAHEWQLPLLRLDFGRLFASLIGQSEQRVRKMIEIAEALSPCVLWVDEIDKAFAGAQSSGDSGTTSRVLATFITWLSEKTSPVFVVSTANNIELIPPEILRKGRFDEMFFLNLPTREEREAIFEVHLKKYRPDSIENFQIPLLGQLSKEFSGAEIEQVVIDAMRLGFNEDREFNNEDILVSIQNCVPLARTRSKELDQLKSWAESGNVISASKYS